MIFPSVQMSSNETDNACVEERPLWLGVCRRLLQPAKVLHPHSRALLSSQAPTETAALWCVIAAPPGVHLASWPSHPKSLIHIQSPTKSTQMLEPVKCEADSDDVR